MNDYIKKLDSEAERRFLSTELRANEDSNVIEGYAAVFNKDSENFGGWIERIAPGAFDDVLNDSAFALFNHDPNLVLGRNGVNVTLSIDETGLKYRIDLPDTATGNEVKSLVRSGIINKSSFAFTVKESEWKFSDSAEIPDVRTIKKLRNLYDVAPVTYPAYPDTSVASRSRGNEDKKEDNRVAPDTRKRISIEILKLKSQ